MVAVIYVLSLFHLTHVGLAAILQCVDNKGVLILPGKEYVPNKKEPCQKCTCEGGYPATCRQLPCADPPKNCKNIVHAEGCCKYICLDRFVRTQPMHVEKENCTDVVIVGAGVSGAYAAWLLRGRNLTVEMYEYSNRIGGRLHTSTLANIPDVNIELGGMRFIPEHHPKLYKLTKTLNLDVLDFNPENPSGETLYFLRGRQLKEKDLTSSKLPYHLKDEERRKSPGELRWQLLSGHTNYTDQGPRQFRISRDLLQITTKDGLLLHDQSYETVIGQYGSSEGYHYIRDTEGFDSFFGSTSAAIHVPLPRPGEIRRSFPYKTLKKGMDHLPNILIEKALKGYSNRLHRNRRLVKILRLPSGSYQLTFKDTVTKKDGYTRDTYGKTGFTKTCAKKVILAVPRKALEGIAWRDAHKNRLFRRYLKSVVDTKGVKIYLGFRKAWWRNAKQNFTKIVTDLPLRQVYTLGVSPESGRAVLLVVYRDAGIEYWKRLAKLGKTIRGAPKTRFTVTNQVVKHVKRQLAEILGMKVRQIPDPISGVMTVWDEYPYGGAFNMWLPGYDWDEVRKVMMRPGKDGNIFTVGSAFAFHDNQAWVEGALERTEEVIDNFF